MFIKGYRSILALILVLVTTFLVSCGGPSASKQPPTYTAQQIEQIQQYADRLESKRQRMSALAGNIQDRDWVEVGSLIHGPLGTLRQEMSYLSQKLLPQDQKIARDLAKDLFKSLNTIDAAASEGDYSLAIRNYGLAIQDLDEFLKLVPEQG
ncbi:MAG: photosystem II protein PsbQ [Symploca sp. SIO1A3]|nr:photosystem II protein PsbQ [Symploca sp. SIO2C1]NER51015.1 photosystem II protein PsbQ [Symploca sp. SIO1A3]